MLRCINFSGWESLQTSQDLPQSLQEATCCQKLEEWWKSSRFPSSQQTPWDLESCWRALGIQNWGAEGLSLHRALIANPGWDPAGKPPSAPSTEPSPCKPTWEGGEASLAAINGFHGYRWKTGNPSHTGEGTKRGKKGGNHHPCPDVAKGT